MGQYVPATPAEFDENRIIERPDGVYWQAREGGREHGPFPSVAAAIADMEMADDVDQAETPDARDAQEAEDVLGVPDWVDPDTGELADDERTRTEDH